MNGQNTPVADTVSVQQATTAPVAAPAQQVQADSTHADSLVVYKIVNGERAGEEIVLAPCARKDTCAMKAAQPDCAVSKNVHVEFEASGVVVVILVVALLAFLGYALSVLRSIMLGEFKGIADASAAPAPVVHAAAPAAPAAPVAHAAPAASAQIHPGLTNEQLVVLLGVAAAEVLGPNVQVVKFRPMNNSDWSWAAQGRSDLHSNRLV